MLTHLLVTFNGDIAAVQTNVLGRVHDSTAARRNKLFPQVLGKNRFALGDPGYAGVPWVVAGFKTNQLKTPEARRFDTISRAEQAQVEHVNNFIKKCQVLSKTNMFRQGREKHVACVFIVCGWFNWMKWTFGKLS
jgi:hypothetical protein